MRIQRIQATPNWWCRTMHSRVSLPRYNRYRCRQCERVYLVPWAGRPPVSGEPAPGSWTSRGLQKFLGLIRAAFSPHPELRGRMGAASNGD